MLKSCILTHSIWLIILSHSVFYESQSMTHHYIYLREQTASLNDFRIKKITFEKCWFLIRWKKYWFLIGLDMVIDSNSILSRVPPPGAVPVSLSEAAHMWSNEITSRNVSLVGMVVKIKAPNQSKTEPKVKKNIVPIRLEFYWPHSL